MRLLAVERLLRGTVLVAAGVVAYHVATRRASLLSWVEQLLIAARPLGDQLGLHLRGLGRPTSELSSHAIV
ncbi:MAG TPA: hypothetical protein VM429_00865 [Micropruina sp.]|nr:hypothetical protein [Micropruina sp.]